MLEGTKGLPDRITRVRDLILWEMVSPAPLVVASDSLGGIGTLPQDSYPCSPQDAGYFTARVVLFELLAAGAIPRLMLFCLANGGEYARLILEGIRQALDEAGMPGDFPVNGSSEKNVVTQMTAVGITLIGVRGEDFRPGKARAGDHLWLVGRPKSAPHDQVVRGDPQICGFSHLQFLTGQPGVHDIVPVGSGGARPEIDALARQSVLEAVIDPGCADLLARSGGPATALVAAVAPAAASILAGLGASLPVQRVGALDSLP
ncbi:MAG TPA: AIR synthase related protein [Spirochaetia bacterium]|nr:AIR synthase related protein [Spirochaetia bacterium]